MSELAGRVALVTGGQRGLGAASARALAAKGAKVVVTDVGDGEPVAREIGGVFLKHDVTREEEWVAAVKLAQEKFGGLDILVNNAGIFWTRPIVDTAIEDFRRMQQINVEGVFLGMKHAIPALSARAQQWDGGAAIVNISSIAGIVGSPLTCAYNASKGAVRLMTKAAAMECAALKIRVNSVHPGVIDTPMAQQVFDGYRAAGQNDGEQRIAERHPLGHIGRDIDIANAVAFLASDSAAFMTGSEVVVDGGWTAN